MIKVLRNMTNLCNHDWEKVAETILPSPFEQLNERKSAFDFKSSDMKDFHRKKYILVLKCKLCGLLDKTIEVNP